MDIEISNTQVILRVDATLVLFQDGSIIREAWLAWCFDREADDKVFMAVVHSAHVPYTCSDKSSGVIQGRAA